MKRFVKNPAIAFSVCTCVIVLIAGTVHFVKSNQSPPRQQTPEEFLNALNQTELEYEGRWAPKLDGTNYALQGFHLKRKGDTRSWEELFAVTIPTAHCKQHVIIMNISHWEDQSSPYPGTVRLATYLEMIGDPEEIDRILDALR